MCEAPAHSAAELDGSSGELPGQREHGWYRVMRRPPPDGAPRGLKAGLGLCVCSRVRSSSIHNSQELEAARCLLMGGGQTKRGIGAVEYCSALERNDVLTCATRMNLEDMLGRLSRSPRDRYCRFHVCEVSDSERQEAEGPGRGAGLGHGWEGGGAGG